MELRDFSSSIESQFTLTFDSLKMHNGSSTSNWLYNFNFWANYPFKIV